MVAQLHACKKISIHVPRVGDDPVKEVIKFDLFTFLSTSPAWGTTVGAAVAALHILISIHVPRVGDDAAEAENRAAGAQFLSTSPAWGTTHGNGPGHALAGFLSTSPAWGTTRAGGHHLGNDSHFYPRPPRGGRRSQLRTVATGMAFLSTSPAWGTTPLQ